MATTKLKGAQIFDGTIKSEDIDDSLEKEFTKVRVTTDDTTPDFLFFKVVAGDDINFTVIGPAGTNQTLAISSTIAPGGTNTNVQYNNNGDFGGSSNFTFNGSTVFITGSLSQGNGSKATGQYSYAGGADSESIGVTSHAEGSATKAIGSYSHSEGRLTVSQGQSSHSEGEGTTAYGNYSHAEGQNTAASGSWSHAEGYESIASGSYSHAEGYSTFASGSYSHTEGYNTNALSEASHAEGYQTTASGSWSHAEGYESIASGSYSHAEGFQSLASGEVSHAEGAATQATGDVSHAEGSVTKASGFASHSEGRDTIASGYAAHAEGNATRAIGDHSHTTGLQTIASGSNQTVIGKYNKRNNTDSLFIIGNGDGDTDTARDDIFIVNSGSIMIGSASLGGDTFFYVGTRGVQTISRFDGSIYSSGTITSTNGFSGSLTKLANGTSYLIAGSNVTITTGSTGAVTIAATAGSTSPGGSNTSVQYNNAGSFGGTATFTYNGTNVYLLGAFAQGNSSIPSGLRAHAEGFNGTSTGNYSHSEGFNTVAKGDYSHAEGNASTAVGTYSHAQGIDTLASGSGQNVVGKYNKQGNTDSLFIVGNGGNTTNAGRSDIFLVNTGSVLIGSANLGTDTFFYVSGSSTTNRAVFGGDVVVSGTLYNKYAGNNLAQNSVLGRVVTEITSSYSDASSTTGGVVVATVTLPAYTFINVGDRVKCTYEFDHYAISGTRTINFYLSGSAGRYAFVSKGITTTTALVISDFVIVKSALNSQIHRGTHLELTAAPARVSGSTSHDETQPMYLITELTSSAANGGIKLISYGVTLQ